MVVVWVFVVIGAVAWGAALTVLLFRRYAHVAQTEEDRLHRYRVGLYAMVYEDPPGTPRGGEIRVARWVMVETPDPTALLREVHRLAEASARRMGLDTVSRWEDPHGSTVFAWGIGWRE